MIIRSGGAPFELITVETHTVLPPFDEAVRTGLMRPAGERRIPCRFLYDERGSQLFEEICELPEYYPTRTEVSILETNADDIVRGLEPGSPIVEFGSGSERKITPLLEAVIRRDGSAHYMPIDISPSILEENGSKLIDQFGDALQVTAFAGEYRDALERFAALGHDGALGLWLGGSIGNMERREAASFLEMVREQLPRIVVGVDLRKSRDVLIPAYDDPSGVTAEFSLNLLRRVSKELDADFDLGAFRHVADYDEETGKVEIELESLRDQSVAIDAIGLDLEFAKGERIHIEDSTKYSFDEIDTVAVEAGYRVDKRWTDPQQKFSVNRFVS